MADFLGTRDSNVAISEDNAGRKVLILDTITQVDSLVGNIDSDSMLGQGPLYPIRASQYYSVKEECCYEFKQANPFTF